MSHEVIQPQEQEASELKSPYEKAYLDTADHYNKTPTRCRSRIQRYSKHQIGQEKSTY